MTAVPHEHSFSSLYAHYGPYGRQDVHYHPCIESERCNWVMVGEGRHCDGRAVTHKAMRGEEAAREHQA